jgi:hypothetical protein
MEVARTRRVKSPVVVLLPQRIVPTRRPAKRSRFNNPLGRAPRTPAIEQRGPVRGPEPAWRCTTSSRLVAFW